MTDRELLELAAKAEGSVEYHEDAGGWCTMEEDGDFPDAPWMPLDDDGDALRLAVKLGLHISVRPHRTEVLHWRKLDLAVDILGFDLSEPIIKLLAKVDHNEDAYFATRRAIVMAAAEIGKDKNNV